jgi:hypothetical protein
MPAVLSAVTVLIPIHINNVRQTPTAPDEVEVNEREIRRILWISKIKLCWLQERRQG